MDREHRKTPRLIGCLCLLFCATACTPDSAGTREGAALYATYCLACHGEAGEGDGPVAAVMSVSVPNLRTLRMRNDGTFPVDAVTAYVDGRDVPAAHGDRRMPVWGDVFQWNEARDSEETARRRIDAVVDYLQRLQYR